MKKESTNPLFNEMQELITKGNEEEFLFFINSHQELLKEDPILFIGNHVSFYAVKEDVTNALATVAYYKNAPYISMEVEDFLNELKIELEKIQKPITHEYSLEDLSKLLLSNNENSIASALHYLSKKNIRLYLPVIQEFLLSDVLYKYKTLALFILVEQHVENDIKVEKNKMIYTLNPSLLDLPFDTFAYADCKEKITKSDNDPDVIKLAIELLNTTLIKEYPDTFVENDNTSLMSDVFILLGKKYLLQDTSIKLLAKKYEINETELNEQIKEIEEVIKS